MSVFLVFQPHKKKKKRPKILFVIDSSARPVIFLSELTLFFVLGYCQRTPNSYRPQLVFIFSPLHRLPRRDSLPRPPADGPQHSPRTGEVRSETTLEMIGFIDRTLRTVLPGYLLGRFWVKLFASFHFVYSTSGLIMINLSLNR